MRRGEAIQDVNAQTKRPRAAAKRPGLIITRKAKRRQI